MDYPYTHWHNKTIQNNDPTSSSLLPIHLDIQRYTPGQLWREVMAVMAENSLKEIHTGYTKVPIAD